MDSQDTLINTAFYYVQQSQDGLTILDFSQDSMSNTRIFIRGRRGLSYDVLSNRDNTTTTVHRVDDCLKNTRIALIERSNLLSDKITFGNGRPMKLSQWLTAKPLTEFPVKVRIAGSTYIWKKNIVDQLWMVSEDEPDTPLAWFQRPRREMHSGYEIHRPAMLVISSKIDECREEILVACLVLEQKIRLRARASGITMGAEPLWRGSHHRGV